MRKILKGFLIFFLLGLIFILYQFRKGNSISKTIQKITEYQVVLFLNKEEASEYLLSNEDFFNQMNDYLDASLRLKRDLSSNTREENLMILRKHISKQTENWTDLEQKRLSECLTQAQRKIKEKSSKILLDTVYVIKTTGSEEFGAWYTVKKGIVVPKSEFWKFRFERMYAPVINTLIHEYQHIFSRYKPEFRNKLYKEIGFEYVENIKIPKSINNQRITNPDNLNGNYICKIDNEKYFFTPFSKEKYFLENKFREDKKYGYLSTYSSEKLFQIEVAEVLGDTIPLSNKFYEQIGEISDYIFGVDEILAVALTKVILQDYKENKKYSKRDIEILKEFEKIID